MEYIYYIILHIYYIILHIYIYIIVYYIHIYIIIIIFHIYIIDIHHVFRRLATVLVCVFGMPKLAFVADSRAMSPHHNNLC